MREETYVLSLLYLVSKVVFHIVLYTASKISRVLQLKKK